MWWSSAKNKKASNSVIILKKKIIVTSDGSHSISIEDWGETYHSIHGAIQESRHVYIQNGLHKFNHQNAIRVLEFGFGTGLNALLTMQEITQHNQILEYHTIEAFPLQKEEYELLDYSNNLKDFEAAETLFKKSHDCSWGNFVSLSDAIQLHKINARFEEVDVLENYFDLVYFDVFGYQFQPDLWTEAIFKKAFDSLKTGGILVTYACRSIIRRNMKSVGFLVERVPGPPGKREMIVAYKN